MASNRTKLWLNGFHDVSANLGSTYDLVQLALADLNNDGEYLLAVMTVPELTKSKITIFKGPYVVNEIELDELATGLCVLTLETSYPGLVVAAGGSIYIYKNFKPFYKFSLPKLTESSEPQITLLTSMFRYPPDVSRNSLLIIGTEEKLIYIVDPQAFTVIATIDLPSIPVTIKTTGYYDVESHIAVSTRDSTVFAISPNNQVEAKALFISPQPVFDILLHENGLLVVTSNKMTCLTLQGSVLWSFNSEYRVTSATTIVGHDGEQLALFATTGGFVNLLRNGQIVDKLVFSDEIISMLFGRFGREESALILITKGGELIVKILNRAFNMNTLKAAPLESPNEIGLETRAKKAEILPQRTKLFVEQSFHEQQDPAGIYEAFQCGLIRIRLKALQQLTSITSTTNGALLETRQSTSINATSVLIGNGPSYKLQLKIHNCSQNVLENLRCSLLCTEGNLEIGNGVREDLGFVFPASFMKQEYVVNDVSGQGGFLNFIITDNADASIVYQAKINVKPVFA